MNYYIIAGEASGDLHGANLIKALQQQDPDADFRCWGGDRMQAAGGTLVKHYRDLAFMGFIEVLLHLSTILRNLSYCKEDITAYQPDVIIFIDYPGFNLRIAKWAKAQQFKTHYYISPQLWAWKENRIRAIKRDIDAMYVILPFEKAFYEQKHQFPVHFVGHPLIDAIADRPDIRPEVFKEAHQLDNRPVIALLPGSRKQEIKRMLSVMLSIVDDFPDHQFVIAGAPNQDYAFYQKFIQNKNVRFIADKTYDILSIATAALVTSGTATLEAALFNVPEVVCYRGNWISYQIAKRIITLDYISLVNLIMDKEVVTELIQHKYNTRTLKTALQRLLTETYRESILTDYNALEETLGGRGASQQAATLIYKNISVQNNT
ncbi:MAG: lipid-A-disaccharide synthase [Bacteroidota bacterium]